MSRPLPAHCGPHELPALPTVQPGFLNAGHHCCQRLLMLLAELQVGLIQSQHDLCQAHNGSMSHLAARCRSNWSESVHGALGSWDTNCHHFYLAWIGLGAALAGVQPSHSWSDAYLRLQC